MLWFSDMRAVVIHEGRSTELDATVDRGTLRIALDALAPAMGWKLEAQGLCDGDVCVLPGAIEELTTSDGVDVAGLAKRLGRAFAMDDGVAVVGARFRERIEQLTSLEAPDFTLPDLAGHEHSLSELRGKKTLLVAWASW